MVYSFYYYFLTLVVAKVEAVCQMQHIANLMPSSYTEPSVFAQTKVV